MKLDIVRPIKIENLARLGNEHDGGYVVPIDAVQGTRMLVSFGVSDDWSFEEHFISIAGVIPVHAYDHTVGSWKFAKRALIHTKRAMFGKLRWDKSVTSLPFRFMNFFSGKSKHFANKISNNGDGNSVTIDAVFQACPINKDIFLKMDIEGDEYLVIQKILEYSKNLRGAVIEFHDVADRWDEFSHHISELKKQFYICHIHGNNYGGMSPEGVPHVLEVTFVHKSLIGQPVVSTKLSYPIEGLDNPNNPVEADIRIDFK